MKVFRVQGPDGRIHRIEGPDDATAEEITAYAESTITDAPLGNGGGPLTRNSPRRPQAAEPVPETPGLLTRAATAVREFVSPPSPLEKLSRGSPQPPAPDQVSLRPGLREQVIAAFDSATPAQRQQLAARTDYVGPIAKQLLADHAATDALGTRSAIKLDSRVESREARLAGTGLAADTAHRLATDSAATGVAPGTETDGYGSAVASDFNFDRARAWRENPVLDNAIVRGVAKGGVGFARGAAGLGEFAAELFTDVPEDQRDSLVTSRLQQLQAEMGTSRDAPGVEAALSSITQQLPGLLTGTAPAALASMAVTSFGNEYSDGRAAKLDSAHAAARASAFAAFEIVGEKFGLGPLLGKIKDAGRGIGDVGELTRFFAQQLKREVPGELLTTTGQFLTDKVPEFGLNQEAGWDEYLQQVGSTIEQTLLQGGITAGGIAGGAAAVRFARGNQDAQAGADISRDNSLAKWDAFGKTLAAPAPTQSFTPPDSLIAQAGITPITVPGLSPAPAAMAENAPSVSAPAQAAESADLTGQYPTQLATDGDLLTQVAKTAPDYHNDDTQAPAQSWFGRRGDGYVTEADAQQALPGRQRIHRELEWRVESVDGGKYKLAGYARGQTPATTSAPTSSKVVAAEQAPDPAQASVLPKMDTAPAAVQPTWEAFPPASGSLGIPRVEMPQIRSEHRGAMVNFLQARGVTATHEVVEPGTLKPTQAEYSPEKVDDSKAQTGDRSVLVSSDGHVVDGHHQWLAALEAKEPVKVIRLGSPAKQLLTQVRAFPSAQASAQRLSDLDEAQKIFAPVFAEIQKQQDQKWSLPTPRDNAGISTGGRLGMDRDQVQIADVSAATGADDATPTAQTFTNGERSESKPTAGADEILRIPAASVRSLDAAPAGSDGRRASGTASERRLRAQIAVDRFDAKYAHPERTAVFGPPRAVDAVAEAQVNELATALGSAWGGNITAFRDNRRGSPNGIAVGGNAFINLRNPEHNAAHLAFHENYHVVEQIARLDRRAGKHASPANHFVSAMENLFDDMSREGKAAYLTQFLRRDDYARLSTDDLRESFIERELRSPELKSEMIADFFGNRGRDRQWLKSLAEADPQGFKAFVDKWLAALDNLIKALRGSLSGSRNHSELVDTYVKNLEAAKTEARTALVEYGKHARRTAQQAEEDGLAQSPAHADEDAPVHTSARQQQAPANAAPARFFVPEETDMAGVRRTLQDAQIRMRVIQDAVRSQGGVVDEQRDTYRAWELMPGRIESVVEKFDRDFVTPFIDVLAKTKITPAEISVYAYAMHAQERNADIKARNPMGVAMGGGVDQRIVDAGSGMTDADAQRVKAQVRAEGRQAKFDQAYAALRRLIETNRDAMRDYGLITQAEHGAIANKYSNWVPLRGLERVDHDQDEFTPRRGRGLDIRGAETMPAMGRISRASDILENILTDFYQTATRGERNTVNRVLLDMVLANPDASLWEVDPMTHIREERAPASNPGQRILVGGQPTTGLVEGYMKPETRTDVIALKVAGVPVYIRVKDALLRRALLDEWRGNMNSLPVKVMSAINTVLRNTLTRYNPPFAVANAARDMQQAQTYIVGELGARAGAAFMRFYPKALAAAGRAEFGKNGKQLRVAGVRLFGDPVMDRHYDEFLASGALTGGFYMKDVVDITRDIHRRLKKLGGVTGIRGVRDLASVAANTKLIGGMATPAQLLHLIEAAGAVSENATRFALYHAARTSGATKTTAAGIAKNGTTNFNRKGEWGPMLNTLYLFSNASIQGARSGLHSLAKSRHRGKVAALAASWVGVGVAMALWGAGAGGDDDNGDAYWDMISLEEKRRNWIIMLPPGDSLFEGATRVGSRGRYIKFPMPYLWNVFPVMGYGVADAIRHRNDPSRGRSAGEVMADAAGAVIDSTNPIGGAVDVMNPDALMLAMLPTLADIPFQFAYDVNAFGTPTSPNYQSVKVPDHENVRADQAGNWGHETSRWLYNVTDPIAKAIGSGKFFDGRGVSIKPGTIENSVYTLTGGTGRFVGDILSTTLHLVNEQNPVTPNSVPFLNKMYGEVNEKQAAATAYDRAGRSRVYSDLLAKEKGLGYEPRSAYEARMIAVAGAAEAFQAAMGRIRKQQILVMSDATVAKSERVAAANELRQGMDEVAMSFNQTYKEIMTESDDDARGIAASMLAPAEAE